MGLYQILRHFRARKDFRVGMYVCMYAYMHALLMVGAYMHTPTTEGTGSRKSMTFLRY